MAVVALFAVFILFLFLGTPVGFAMLAGALSYIFIEDISLYIVAQRLGRGVDSFPLLAMLFFVLAGNLMNTGGITRRIFRFANAVVGRFPGGLGHANIAASVIFSGMSGSAVADTGGLGAIELEAMKDAGYPEDFSLSITGASAIIGPIIPPSVPAVVYGVVASVSIGRLFAAGLIPGLLMAVALSVAILITSRIRSFPKPERAPFREVLKSLGDSFFALLTPVIIIGGIVFGIVTPTEAAIVAVGYALVLGFFYREIHPRDIPRIVLSSLKTTLGILFIIAVASLFGYLLTVSQIPQRFAEYLLSLSDSRIVLLLIINGVLLIAGLFLEPAAAMVILVPVLMPVAASIGLSPVHFGIIVILNLMLGLMTPPVGLVLYVLSGISNVPFERISRSILPYLMTLLVVLMIVTFVPAISMTLPTLLFD